MSKSQKVAIIVRILRNPFFRDTAKQVTINRRRMQDRSIRSPEINFIAQDSSLRQRQKEWRQPVKLLRKCEESRATSGSESSTPLCIPATNSSKQSPTGSTSSLTWTCQYSTVQPQYSRRRNEASLVVNQISSTTSGRTSQPHHPHDRPL